jgi:hypothetical protein
VRSNLEGEGGAYLHRHLISAGLLGLVGLWQEPRAGYLVGHVELMLLDLHAGTQREPRLAHARVR